MGSLKDDLEFGFENEKIVSEYFETLGRSIIERDTFNVLDFQIIDKNGNEVFLELKTRRCAKDDYIDTMIGVNKIIEALSRYNSEGKYTLFLFKFTDGLYYINPFLHLPRYDYRRGRYDRGAIDSEKAWAYYKTKDLIFLTK